MIDRTIAERVATEFGTPTYVYDLDEVRRAHSDLSSVLPSGAQLFYSLKSNPHPEIVRELVFAGASCEVTSLGELDVALSSGVDRDNIVVGGPAKSRDLLGAALMSGVRRLSIESPTDLRRASSVAIEAGGRFDAVLRINADQAVGGMPMAMTGQPSQFGSDYGWVIDEPHLFAADRVRIDGFHLYMGSNIDDPDVLIRQFEVSLAMVAPLRRALGIDCRHLNLGGGFAWPYATAGTPSPLVGLRDALEARLSESCPGWSEGTPQISFESGRFLSGRCGTLLTTVADVKTSKGAPFVILDGGVNQLGGMSGLKRIPRIVPDLVAGGPERRTVEGATVAGPLCTPLDRLSQGASIPALAEGDLVAVPNAGAYGLTASLIGFLGHPIATEVVVDRGAVVSASRLELHRSTVNSSRDLSRFNHQEYTHVG